MLENLDKISTCASILKSRGLSVTKLIKTRNDLLVTKMRVCSVKMGLLAKCRPYMKIWDVLTKKGPLDDR